MNNNTGTEQHIYHHSEPTAPRISINVEKNSRGLNWQISVSGAGTVAEAMALLTEAETALQQRYGAILSPAKSE